MRASLLEKKGMKLEPFTFQVEKGKIKELALAIGDLRAEYLSGEAVMPTFATVIDFWGSGISSSELLGLNMKKVVHGEQSYEYLGEIRPGDKITVHGVVEDVYTKAAMNFVILKKEFINQHGKTVLISRSTIIERH